MEESPIIGRTYNTIYKAEFPKQGLQKAVGVKETPTNQKAVGVKETPTNQETVGVKETPTKQISVVVPHWDPNILYKELYEEDPQLLKAMIAKVLDKNEDKPSYKAAMAGPEVYLWC